MKRLALVAIVVGALAAPSTAAAGGVGAWALKGPSRTIKAGDVWLAQLRVVSCMGQPADYVPSVAIVDQTSGRMLKFQGKQTGAPGRYTARVVFPSAGSWSYRVDVAGWPSETFGPFRVGPAPRSPDRLVAALPPLGAVLLVLGTGVFLRRRRA